MRYYTLLIGASFLPSLLFSAPAVTGGSGTPAHGNSYTVTGTGFGTKSPAAPDIFDTFETGDFNAGWANTKDLGVATGNQRSSNSVYHSTLNFRSGVDEGELIMDSDTSEDWFCSYWFYLGSDWNWGTDNFPDANRFLENIKVFRLWDPGANAENLVVATNGSGNNFAFDIEAITPAQADNFFSGFRTGGIPLETWHQFEFEFSDNSGLGNADGEFYMWHNTTIKYSTSAIETREDDASFKRPFIVGFWNSWSPGSGGDYAPNTYYMDDVYCDTTWSRVELCDASTYSSCTQKEIQPPTSWSATSVTFTINYGSFADGADKYIYVTDSNGDTNSSGYLMGTENSSTLDGNMTIYDGTIY